MRGKIRLEHYLHWDDWLEVLVELVDEGDPGREVDAHDLLVGHVVLQKKAGLSCEVKKLDQPSPFTISAPKTYEENTKLQLGPSK